MIEIFGEDDTSEYRAALAIKDALVSLWPSLNKPGADEGIIKLAAGAKISGYRISDIDIIIALQFLRGKKFIPRKSLTDNAGGRVVGKPVTVSNLVVAVEVKDHDASAIRTVGDNVEVRYVRNGSTKWSSATEQNINQVHSLREYFRDQDIDVYVHRLVMLRGVSKVKSEGVLPAEFSGADLLTAIAKTAKLLRRGGEYCLNSCASENMKNVIQSPLFTTLVPTSLDRKRMDHIGARAAESGPWLSQMGKKMLRFRGRGGTGKTILLLQLAAQQFEENNARTLVLTYNHALAADIRRLLALIGMPSRSDSGGVEVRTVMSFMMSWFRKLELLGDEEIELEDYSSYNEMCANALAMLQAGALQQKDVDKIKLSQADRFDYDYIVVDEAQDWPSGELELVKALYRPNCICLADGVDQLVRGGRADWERGLAEDEREVIPLRTCLRMKANLTSFANSVAVQAGTGWRSKISDKAGGGRIIVVKGSYADHTLLHEKLFRNAHAAGNAELDFLICVPPGGVVSDQSGQRYSRLGRVFQERGYLIWDGTNEHNRRDFSRSAHAYRIVQYDSCRGLEGWTVIADGLDEFWEYKRNQILKSSSHGADSAQLADDAASAAAWEWCMIPLTRPIDTLVLCLRSDTNSFSKAILHVAKNKPDSVEIQI